MSGQMRSRCSLIQLDFWPELLNKGMVHYSRLAGNGSTLHTAVPRYEPLSARACPQLREDSRGLTAGNGDSLSKTRRQEHPQAWGVRR